MSVWHFVLGLCIGLAGLLLALACCYVNVDPTEREKIEQTKTKDAQEGN